MSCNSLRIKRPVPYLEYGRLRYWRGKLWIGERNAWIGRHKIVIIELFIMSRLEQDPRSAKNILLCVSDRVRATNKDGIGFLGFDTDWHWILCMYPQRAQSWKISDMCLRELCGQRLWTHLLSNLENLVPSPIPLFFRWQPSGVTVSKIIDEWGENILKWGKWNDL